LARRGRGEYIGEGALLNDEPRNADVKAVGRVASLHMEVDAFKQLLGPLHDLLAHNFVVKALVQVPLLRMLSTNELDAIVEELQESVYSKGEAVIKQVGHARNTQRTQHNTTHSTTHSAPGTARPLVPV
jgi:CRP-like cAMP-binding protein